MDALGKFKNFQEVRVTLLSCSPSFPRASITRYTHAKHESILRLPREEKDITISRPDINLACSNWDKIRPYSFGSIRKSQLFNAGIL